jgi:hypothetical protein
LRPKCLAIENEPLYCGEATRTDHEVKKLPTDLTGKENSVNAKLSFIKCGSCGAETAVVPNVKLMSEAIEAHVEQHRSKLRNSFKAEAEAEQIRDELITQVFEAASKQ